MIQDIQLENKQQNARIKICGEKIDTAKQNVVELEERLRDKIKILSISTDKNLETTKQSLLDKIFEEKSISKDLVS